MSNFVKEEVWEQGDITYRLEWYQKDYYGRRLLKPRIRVQAFHANGWQSPWLDADEIAKVVKAMRERREREQSKLQTNGENIRPNEEETREGSGEQVGSEAYPARDVSPDS